MREEKQGILKGAFALTLASLFVKIVGVFYKIPLSHILNDEGMSLFNSAFAVYTFFFLLCSAGVPKAITLLITEKGERARSYNESILHSASIFFGTAGLILTLLLAILSRPIAILVGNEGMSGVLVAIAPSIFFVAISSVNRGYLTAIMRFGAIAISQGIEAAVKLAAGLLGAYIGYRLGMPREVIAAYSALGISISSAFTYLYLLIEIKIVKATNKAEQSASFSFDNIKQISKIAFPITLNATVMSLVNVVDLMIILRGLRTIGMSANLVDVIYGNYSTLAVPMFNFALTLATSVCTSALPLITRRAAMKRSDALTGPVRECSLLTAFLVTPSAFAFLLYSKECLAILFEGESVAIGSFMLTLLAPSVLFVSILTVINTILEANGCIYAPFISMSVGSAVKLILSQIFVLSSLEIYGAPIGTGVSYLVSLFISVLFLRKKDSVKARDILIPFVFPVVNCTLAAFTTVSLGMIRAAEGIFTALPILRPIIFALLYAVLSFASGTVNRIKNSNRSN